MKIKYDPYLFVERRLKHKGEYIVILYQIMNIMSFIVFQLIFQCRVDARSLLDLVEMMNCRLDYVWLIYAGETGMDFIPKGTS